jgi:hypothetical protein
MIDVTHSISSGCVMPVLLDLIECEIKLLSYMQKWLFSMAFLFFHYSVVLSVEILKSWLYSMFRRGIFSLPSLNNDIS